MSRRHRTPTSRAAAVLVFLTLTLPAVVVTAAPAAHQPPGTQQTPRPEIIGGMEATPGDWPFMVAVVSAGVPSAFAGQFCGGSLIEPQWVLTAAHCVDGLFPASIDAVLGRHDLTSSNGERIGVSSVLIHPKYDDVTNHNDVALMRLNSPSSFPSIDLATTENGPMWVPGTIATVMGWGLISQMPDVSPSRLHEVDLSLIADSGCAAAYGALFDAAVMTCAGDLVLGGIDGCEGDSGGPLVVPGGGSGWIHVGVVSWGTGCALAGFPGVYARTAAFQSFIRTNVVAALSDDAASVDSGGSVTIDVLANDVNPDGEPLSVTLTVPPPNGSVVLEADQTVTYTNDGSPFSSDAFAYRVDDGTLSSLEATVTVSVTVPNLPPSAAPDSASVIRGMTVRIDVLANDSDPNGDPLSVSVIGPPAHGTAIVQGDGSIAYTHDGSGGKPDSFSYVADDGQATSDPVLVTIAIADPAQMGLVDVAQGLWHLRDFAGMTTSFFFGNPGDVPMMGDWNCDGTDTPGLYRQADGFVYLRNSNTQGIADIRFFFGNPGDISLAGDFNGDGCDTVSIFRPSQGRVFIINQLGANESGLGGAEFDYFFGNPGDKPYVGDFDGDGVETVGLHRESTGLAYFRNSHTQGFADFSFIFGDPGDRLVAADWTDDGIDSVGIYRPSDATFYLRYTNTQGVADEVVPFGEGPWLPVTGEFGI